MLNSSQFSQPTLPGLNEGPRVERAKAALPFVEHERSKWSGAIPGQQVMGVHDLGGDGPRKVTYEIDKTGMVNENIQIHDGEHVKGSGMMKGPPTTGPEQHLYDSKPARFMYATHGGALANNVIERLRSAHGPGQFEMEGHTTPESWLKEEDGWSTRSIESDVNRTKALHAHWASQPLHHIPTDTPIHSAQAVGETETEKPSSQGLRQSLQNGEQIREPAWIMKKAGRLYALDAHHRMNAARQEGLGTFPARVWDWDAENRPSKGKPKAALSAIAAMPKPKGL